MFRKILSAQWEQLSPALQKHYGLQDGEEITLKGELSVKHGKFMKLIMPFVRLTGALVPVEGERFQVTVMNQRRGNAFLWRRQFKKDKKKYIFNSVMSQFGNDIVETVGPGIGIKMRVIENKGGMQYIDKGYVIQLGRVCVPVPLRLLMGKSHIEEFVSKDSEHDINMHFDMSHPLFGFMFSYQGYFDVDNTLENRESI